MKLGEPDEADEDSDIEEESGYEDELDLNNYSIVSKSHVQKEQILSTIDIINQVAIVSLGEAINFNQKYNFTQAVTNLEMENPQSHQSTASNYLASKEPSVQWEIMPWSVETFSKSDTELKPILNIEGDNILSFLNQLIGVTMLQKICDWTNELKHIELSIEELRC